MGKQIMADGLHAFLLSLLTKRNLAIVGAGGGLGSLACQYAKAMGYKVLAISSGASKRHMCLTELGADYYVDYKSADLVEEVKGVTRGGPHAAVIVSSVEEPFHQALQVRQSQIILK